MHVPLSLLAPKTCESVRASRANISARGTAGRALHAALLIVPLLLFHAGCAAQPQHDEIIACGQRFHTGTRIVLWNEPGGYNAYAPPVHFNQRVAGQEPALAQLQQIVDQFVIHYDACGSSAICFRVLHFDRGLSVHFMLDTDGTIYQTLDLKERAWHATTSNSRSIGIEIANIGAFESPNDPALMHRPDQPLMKGIVQGQTLYQRDFTPQQYDALIKLTAALHRVFPRIELQFPPTNQKLPDAQLANYHGVLGHYHIQANKQDPGPAFQWERVLAGARQR